MKVKKFDNLWAMGLILFGAILVGLYLLKLIFPEWVVGVAQYAPIVKFGEFVDSHWWAYYPFTFATSYFGGYFYLCACCRKRKLLLKDNIILAVEIIAFNVIAAIVPDLAFTANVLLMLAMPVVVCYTDKCTDVKCLYSIVSTLTIHLVAQILSLSIRDISTIVVFPNIATLTVLLIDGYIWLILLYCYYNYKEN